MIDTWLAALVMKAEGLVTITQRATDSPYPPSFDNNPVVFGWALFARLFILTLSSATVLRIHTVNRRDRMPANHPVFTHRAASICFLYAAILGSSSDVVTYLLWNETSEYWTTVVMLMSRLFDGMTIIPFAMALFPSLWIRWFRANGVLRDSQRLTFVGTIHDVRATWARPAIPLRLLVYSAGAALFVTAGKYWLWVEHGSR